MTKSKTTIGGLIEAIGVALLGVGVLPQLSELDPTSHMLTHGQSMILWYIALAGFICKGVGAAIASYFSADDSDMQSVAKAVDNINQTGPSPLAPTATDTTTTTKKQ